MSNYKGKSDRKIHDKAIGKEHQSTGWIKKMSIVFLSCILALTLATPMLHADDDLEIGPEIVGQPVGASQLPQPTEVEVRENAKPNISGKVEGSGDRNIRRRVFAYEKDPNTTPDPTELGVSSAVRPVGTFSIKSNKALTKDQVIYLVVKQEKKNGKNWEPDPDFPDSDPLAVTVLPTCAEEYDGKIKVPSDTFFTEDNFQVNNEERAEIFDAFKRDNPTIAGNITKLEIGAGDSSKLTAALIYKDGSKSKAYDLKRGLITEKSAIPEIEKVYVTADKIVGKFKIEEGKTLSPDTKVQLIYNFTDGEEKNFCEGGNCKVDKSNALFANVDIQNGTFTIDVDNDKLILGKEFGIVVKEKNKFASCIKSQPSLAIPEKTSVRDPHKLTDADKKAIDKAIRDANTVKGKSKLPDGTGDNKGTPAFIEFDKDGNVTIISPNDVEVTWDSSYNPVYTKNPDGTYKVNNGAKVTKFPAKDLVKNLKPDSPQIAVNTDDGKVTITPPPYTEGKDTDLLSYTITYKDASGAEKTVTATRDSKTNKWSGTGVDADTGVITLSVEDIEVGGTVTATAKDNGGLEGDTDKLDSDPATKKLETATVSYDGNKGTGEMDGKKLNKGQKYTLETNSFTAPAGQEFKAWEVDGKEVAAGTEITVTKDTVVKAVWKDSEVKVSYNANGGGGSMDSATLKKGSKYTLLESTFKAPDDTQEFKAWEVDGKEVAAGTEITVDKDTEVKAIWKKIQVKVTYDGNGGGGSMTAATVDKGSKYRVLPNSFTAPDDTQEFKAWEVDGKEVAPGVEITVKNNTVVKAVWKKIQVKVTYDANGGEGTMEGKTLDKGSKYTVLPNSFTAPDDTQEFKAWEVDGQEVAPGTEITVKGNTVVKAVWKKIQVNVSYDGNGGSGTMTGKTVDKGSEYTVLPNGFTAPDDTQEFKAWEVDGQEVAPGAKITVKGNTVVKAVWQKIQVKVTYDANGGEGTMEGKTLDKGSKYTVLPNGFTAPDDTQEFKAWEVDGQEVAPGTEITVKGNTVIKAVWKKIKVNVTYEANGGSGTMAAATVDKGSNYTLLPNAFKAPANKKFDTWEIDGKRVSAGTEITVTKDTVVKAVWKSIGTNIGKNIMVKITYDPNGGHWNNDSAKKTIEVKKGTIITIMDAPAWSGYTFQYWKGSEYQPGDSYTANKDHTFVAQWEPNPSVTPSDNPNTPGTPGMVTPNEPNKPNKPGTKAPKTGDMSALSLFASGILAAGGTIALLKKRREER